MADGEVTLRLNADTACLLKETAQAEGVTPEALVDRMLSEDPWPGGMAGYFHRP